MRDTRIQMQKPDFAADFASLFGKRSETVQTADNAKTADAAKTAPAAEQTPARQTGGQSLSEQPSFGQSSVQSLSAPAAAQPAATQQFPSQNGTEQP